MGRAALAALLTSTLVLASCTLFSLDQLQGIVEDGGNDSGGNGNGANNPDGGSSSEGAGGVGAGNSGGNGAGPAGGGGEGNGGEAATYADCIMSDDPAVYLAMNGSATEPNAGSLGGTAQYTGSHEVVTPGLVSGGGDAHSFDVSGTPGELSLEGASSLFGGFQPFSIELWLQPVLPVPTDDLIRFASGLDRLTVEIRGGVAGGDDSLWFRYRTAAGDERAAIHYLELDDEPGEIHHVVAIYRQTAATMFDGSGTAMDLQLYVDGELAQPTGCCSEVPMFTITAPLLIGNGFTGALDEVAIYDRELTAAEISEHYQIGIGALRCAP